MTNVRGRLPSMHHRGRKEGPVITIGIDPHSRTHSAAALDDHGRILAELTVGSNARELDPRGKQTRSQLEGGIGMAGPGGPGWPTAPDVGRARNEPGRASGGGVAAPSVGVRQL